uniref:Uncharacterized protein n=1 Tax=Arundo donax TaxID=35708 RepID=A0A0A8YA07_ARUDO
MVTSCSFLLVPQSSFQLFLSQTCHESPLSNLLRSTVLLNIFG